VRIEGKTEKKNIKIIIRAKKGTKGQGQASSSLRPVPMALPLHALFVSLLLLIALSADHAHAAVVRHGRHRWHKRHAVRVTGKRFPLIKHHRPKFKPGPWKQAHATFYEGGSGSFGIYER
jgi:hypothetical protein